MNRPDRRGSSDVHTNVHRFVHAPGQETGSDGRIATQLELSRPAQPGLTARTDIKVHNGHCRTGTGRPGCVSCWHRTHMRRKCPAAQQQRALPVQVCDSMQQSVVKR